MYRLGMAPTTLSNPLVVSFGDMLWDEFPDGARFGGAAANFACNAARLGARVRMCSAVGRCWVFAVVCKCWARR